MSAAPINPSSLCRSAWNSTNSLSRLGDGEIWGALWRPEERWPDRALEIVAEIKKDPRLDEHGTTDANNAACPSTPSGSSYRGPLLQPWATLLPMQTTQIAPQTICARTTQPPAAFEHPQRPLALAILIDPSAQRKSLWSCPTWRLSLSRRQAQQTRQVVVAQRRPHRSLSRPCLKARSTTTPRRRVEHLYEHRASYHRRPMFCFNTIRNRGTTASHSHHLREARGLLKGVHRGAANSPSPPSSKHR